MKIGISTASLFLRLNNEDSVALLSEWGVETAEVFLSSFCEYTPSFAELLASRKGGLDVHSVHIINTQFEPQLYAEHPRVKGDAFYFLEQVMRSARMFGARNYTFHGIARLKRTFKEDITLTAKKTAEIADFCKQFGVRLCYENVEWAYFNRPELFASLKAACPDLGAVLDIKQARISGYDWREYLSQMAGNLTHVHVSDIDENGKMCLPGRGIFAFDELFVRLNDVGFDGAVIIENYRGDYTELGELKASYEWLKERAEKFR